MKSSKHAIEVVNPLSRYSIHSCGYTYATFMLHDTENLGYVQEQLGVSSISMTTIYENILPEGNGALTQKLVKID